MQQQRRRRPDPKDKVEQVPSRGSSISVVLPVSQPPVWTPPPVFTNPYAPPQKRMNISVHEQDAKPVKAINQPSTTHTPYTYSYSSKDRRVRGIRTILNEDVASFCPFTDNQEKQAPNKIEESKKLIIPITFPEEVRCTEINVSPTFCHETSSDSSMVNEKCTTASEAYQSVSEACQSVSEVCTTASEECQSASEACQSASEECPNVNNECSSVSKDQSINARIDIVNTMSATPEPPILFPDITPKTQATVPTELLTSIIEAQVPDIKNETQTAWPSLTLADINTTFNVVGGFKTGTRLKIVDERYLAEDGSYLSSVYRYTGGQSREKNLSFVGHLFNETKRHTVKLLAEIRQGEDIDTKISELDTMIGKMMVFIHNFDMIREPYQADTGTYAKFGVILDSFSTFRRSFFRDMVLTK
jgi:hypothetical protein